MDNEHAPAAAPIDPETPVEPRPKSSPAAVWIAGLLTLVVVVVIIGAIVSSRQAAEDCVDSWNSYAFNAAGQADMNDPDDVGRVANAYRASANGLRNC